MSTSLRPMQRPPRAVGRSAAASPAPAGSRWIVALLARSRATRWLLVATIVLPALTGVALAQPREAPPVYPAAPGQGPALPFVGENGLGQQVLTLSQVADRLGAPERVDSPPHVRGSERGGYRVWHYPERGLRFHVNREDNDDADPRVAHMDVNLPFDGRTPQGLYLGMPQAEALAIVEAHYRVGTRLTTVGEGGRPVGLHLTARNRDGLRSQTVSVRFHEGRLRSLGFQLKPRPWIPVKAQREMTTLLVLATALVVGGVVVRRVRERMGRAWHGLQVAAGAGAALLGLFLAGSGVAMLGEDPGWGLLVGLVFAVGGVCLAGGGTWMAWQGVRRLDGPTR